jgi:hypothetical protein
MEARINTKVHFVILKLQTDSASSCSLLNCMRGAGLGQAIKKRKKKKIE